MTATLSPVWARIPLPCRQCGDRGLHSIAPGPAEAVVTCETCGLATLIPPHRAQALVERAQAAAAPSVVPEAPFAPPPFTPSQARGGRGGRDEGSRKKLAFVVLGVVVVAAAAWFFVLKPKDAAAPPATTRAAKPKPAVTTTTAPAAPAPAQGILKTTIAAEDKFYQAHQAYTADFGLLSQVDASVPYFAGIAKADSADNQAFVTVTGDKSQTVCVSAKGADGLYMIKEVAIGDHAGVTYAKGAIPTTCDDTPLAAAW